MKAVRTLKSQAGFSLIELMIVVAIIGILASIAVPNFQKFQRKAKQTEGKGYLANIYSAEQSFQAEWSSFTADLKCAGFVIEGKGVYGAGFSATTAAINGTTCIAGNNFAVPTAPTGVALPTAVPGTFVATSSAFNAEVTGNIQGLAAFAAASADNWNITDQKIVTNTQSGL